MNLKYLCIYKHMDDKINLEPCSSRKSKKYVKTSVSKKMRLIKLYYEDKILLKEAARMMNINYSSAKTILRTYRNSKKKCIGIVQSPSDSKSLKGKCFLIYKEDLVTSQGHTKHTQNEIKKYRSTKNKDCIWRINRKLIDRIDYFVQETYSNMIQSQKTLNLLIYLIYSMYYISHNNKFKV